MDKPGIRKTGLLKGVRWLLDVQGGVKTEARRGALHRLGARIRCAGGAVWSVDVLGVGGCTTDVVAAAASLAAGAGPLLDDGGRRAVWADGLTLFDVTSRLTSSASAGGHYESRRYGHTEIIMAAEIWQAQARSPESTRRFVCDVLPEPCGMWGLVDVVADDFGVRIALSAIQGKAHVSLKAERGPLPVGTPATLDVPECRQSQPGS